MQPHVRTTYSEKCEPEWEKEILVVDDELMRN